MSSECGGDPSSVSGPGDDDDDDDDDDDHNDDDDDVTRESPVISVWTGGGGGCQESQEPREEGHEEAGALPGHPRRASHLPWSPRPGRINIL